MMRAALAYASAGFPVFPAKPVIDKAAGSKAPYLRGESSPGAQDGGHWLASTDPAEVGAWWRRWPNALVGFPTGLRSGTVVVDLDTKDAGDADMTAALAEWCGGLTGHDPDTGEVLSPAVARTQSGGLHLYYAYPSPETLAEVGEAAKAAPWSRYDGKIGNATGLFRDFLKAGACPPALDHVDVRGEGGYVIAPPSVMENGARYHWLRRPAKDEMGRWLLPHLPPRLLATIVRLIVPEAVAEGYRRQHARPVRPVSADGLARLIEAKIDGILAKARAAPAGERNQAVFWAAARLGEMVRGGAIGHGEAFGLLIGNLPAGVSAGEHKIRKTIENGLRHDKFPAWAPKVEGRP